MFTIVFCAVGLVSIGFGWRTLDRGEVKFSRKSTWTGRRAKLAGIFTILAGLVIIAVAIGMEVYIYYPR
jgi:hypothetical protein